MSTLDTGITISNLTKRFGTAAAAVDDVSFSVPAGSFLVLLGPSGCGKTTILRMLAGLESPTDGQIAFGERIVVEPGGGVVAPGKRKAGLVFQSYALWPHMTVQANVEWPLKVAKWAPAERKRRVAEVLALLDIAALAARYPGEISGGQQQRVAIARMIAPSPSVLLFDEPLSNLDAKLRVDTRAELVRVHRAAEATSVYVTHDQVEAMTMATHVALMRNGRVEQFGRPEELVERPATSFVATFIGTPPANVVRAHAAGGVLMFRGVRIAVDLPSGIPEGDVDVMYRAESLRLLPSAARGTVPAEFTESTPLAGRHVATLRVDGVRVSVVLDDRPDARPGDVVHIAFPTAPEAWFDVESGRRIESLDPVGAVA